MYVLFINLKEREAYFILLCFALLYFVDTAFFTDWKSEATLRWASLLAPFFQQHLLTSCLCVTSQ